MKSHQITSFGRRLALAVLIVSLGSAGMLRAQEPDDRPLHEQAYIGLSFRPHEETGGLLASWILPGPLGGQGFTAEHFNRSDVILTVNGEVMNPDRFREFIRGSAPGDELTLEIMMTDGPVYGSVPKAGEGTATKTVKIRLDSKADWSGPIAFKPQDQSRYEPETVLPLGDDPTVFETFVNEHLAAQDIDEPIELLLNYFSDTQDKNLGAHSLSRVAYGFYRPTRVAELQQLITDPLVGVADHPSRFFTEAAYNLDATVPTVELDAISFDDPETMLISLSDRVAMAYAHLDLAWDRVGSDRLATLPEDLADVLADLNSGVYLHDKPDIGRYVKALQATMDVDYGELLTAAAVFGDLLSPEAAPDVKDRTPVLLPGELQGAVEGEILAAREIEGRWYIFGGTGPNSYDASRLDVIIDAGGNDVYRYPDEKRPAVQFILDFAGDDRHEAVAAGAASALGGVSILVDVAGSDSYEGETRSCGVGVLGVGLLVDRAGADTYTGTYWSQGVGFYGAGAILDLGNESDTYLGVEKCQGVGGPRGFGLILDRNGRDLYRANGPNGSAYGTPAVYVGFSQGIGIGIRMYDSGGIGVISDLAGDDRYEAGEFSQGGAYFWGLGILHDRQGRDFYYGNRYGQGFGAHQALGVLADDAGDDTYWAMTAASQGGSWDICVGLLIDRAGNDSYQADGLSQGGAAQQAIAWLIDLGGTDRYIAPGGSTQGQSGGNNYHYADSECFSWSMLVDVGGTTDYFSRKDRANGSVSTHGTLNDKNIENSGLYGLFIDTDEQVILWP